MIPSALLSLRLATVTDLPVLRELIPLSVRVLSVDYYSSQQIDSAIRYVFGVDTRLVEDGTYFVVESSLTDGCTPQIAGCGGWSRRRVLYGGDQAKSTATDDDLLNPLTEPARIRAFFVHPAHARRGVAARLLHACRDAAHRAGFTRLELAATLPGEPFYSRHGFAADGLIESILPDGTPIAFVRMSSTIEPPPPA